MLNETCDYCEHKLPVWGPTMKIENGHTLKPIIHYYCPNCNGEIEIRETTLQSISRFIWSIGLLLFSLSGLGAIVVNKDLFILVSVITIVFCIVDIGTLLKRKRYYKINP